MQVVLVCLKLFRRNVLQPKIAKKSLKTPILGGGLKSFKVIDVDVNRKGVWDLILVINTLIVT